MEYGLLGEKLGHSFSKEVHAQIGDYEYLLTEVAREDVPSFMTDHDFKAINVTIPYKETVITYLETISKEAELIGSVNTIINRNGKLYGYNTDFGGMKMMIEKNGIEIAGKKVLILGTGGTSKTARAVTKYLGAGRIIVVSRKSGDGVVSYEEAARLYSDSEVIINTTPVGMYPNNDKSPVDLSDYPCVEGVVDVIYNPLKTKLVLDANSRGIKATGGLYMLVAQAILAGELFFDTEYDVQLYDKIYNKIINEKNSIVLTGMPACGKTTVGKLLSEITGREVIDTDEVIVKNTGRQISEIFATEGETVFRDMESSAVYDASKIGGKVISTGGGAVLRQENVNYLKQNGVICFLDRPLEKLIPTDDRPLANSKDKIVTRFNERYDSYKATADEIINIEDDPMVAVNEILRRLGI